MSAQVSVGVPAARTGRVVRRSPVLVELATELRYHRFSRTGLVVLLIMIAGALLAYSGSVSNASSAHHFFVSQVQLYEENGVDIAAALQAPTSTTMGADGAEMIDNPLKHDYLAVGEALQAISGPVPMIGTVLDLLTFIIVPMVFVFVGAHVATADRRYGTLKQRAARSPLLAVVTAKLLGLVALAAAAVATMIGAGLVLSLAGRVQVDRLAASAITYEVVAPTSVSPLALKVLMTFAVAILFAVAGYAIGAATGSTSWPMVLVAAVLFVLPFQGAWDPRNLLAAVGTGVFDFWGQFELRPPIPVAESTAVLVLLGYGVVSLVLAYGLPRPSRRFR